MPFRMTVHSTRETFAPEHQIFWMLAKKAHKRDDVGRVYLAIQAAIAYRHDAVDVGWLMGAMMAEGRTTMDAHCDALGAGGLAYFYWLYAIELTSPGNADCHHYRFRRRYDGAEVTAFLKTAHAPKSLQFQQVYERERRRLEKKRETLLTNYRWYSTAELFARYDACLAQPPP